MTTRERLTLKAGDVITLSIDRHIDGDIPFYFVIQRVHGERVGSVDVHNEVYHYDSHFTWRQLKNFTKLSKKQAVMYALRK